MVATGSEPKKMNPLICSNDPPLVSVIMPCYNAAPYLAQAVMSALDQTSMNVEVIVVDDGSTDDSLQLLEDLVRLRPERITLLRSDHKGPFPARNLALRHARGDLIAFLDADDWWDASALGKLHSAMTSAGADVAYCGWQNVGEGIVSAPYVPPAYECEDAVAHFVRSCPWPIHGALLRREIVERLGGFCEERYSAMDYHFWLRVLGLTQRLVRVPEVLAYYRWHGSGQISAVKWRQILDARWAQQDFTEQHPELVRHLSAEQISDYTEGRILREAYRALWKRELFSAHVLFRHAGRSGAGKIGDMRHIITAKLPFPLYKALFHLKDRLSMALRHDA